MKKRAEIPPGFAPLYIHAGDLTVCLLCKARGPKSNKLPDSMTRLKVVSTGVAFRKRCDAPDDELGAEIATGRALKALKNDAETRGAAWFYWSSPGLQG